MADDYQTRRDRSSRGPDASSGTLARPRMPGNRVDYSALGLVRGLFLLPCNNYHMESFSFGDSPEMANELLNLVIKGRKTATSWAAVHGTLGSEVGTRQIIKDARGESRVVIEITELTRKPFNQADEAFAHDEGEGDLSLDYWRKEHERYFTQEGTFAEDMEIYCERFKLVEILS